MRYLGLDLGSKTLGIAISDPTNTIASLYTTLYFKDEDYHSLIMPLKEIIDKEEIDTLVLGLPKNMNNSLGYRCEETLEFKKLLEDRFHLEVVLQDERLTTVEATNYMLQADMSRKKRKKKIDALAANIILQTYLDKENGGKL